MFVDKQIRGTTWLQVYFNQLMISQNRASWLFGIILAT